jgi:hypothetical protein
MNVIYECEAYGVEPPQGKYIMMTCQNTTHTLSWFGGQSLTPPPNLGGFTCCGLAINGTYYSVNGDVTNHNIDSTYDIVNGNVTNYVTNNNTNVTNYFTDMSSNVTNYVTNDNTNVTNYVTDMSSNVTTYTSNTNVTNYFTNNTTSNHLSDLSSNSNVTNYFTNNTLTTYLSQFISSDNYSEYALIMSGVSLLISITLVIVSMVISCRNCAENRALRYMMYNRTPNTRIPISMT